MTSPYSIRLCDDEDFISLQLACLPVDRPLALDEGGDWWALYFADAPVGFAALRRSYRFADCGYLSRAGILEDHRGQGLQMRLIRVRESQAKRYGWKWLFSDTCGNPPSANNLAKAGFKMFEPVKPWSKNKTTLYWRKKI